MSEIKLACDVVKQVRAICDKHGNQPGELINILHEAQHLHGYLPEEMQRIIAAQLGIPVSRVYGVVTFYTFFTMLPKGKHPISVCMGTACYRKGRTGDRFMSLVKRGQIANCCQPNALMTLKEYLEDYASPETKEKGIRLICEEMTHIPNPKIRAIAERNLQEIGEGKRDFRF